MHVLFVMASAAQGGGADHLVGILPVLRDAGVRCTILTGRDGDLSEWAAGEGFSAFTLDFMGSRWNPWRVVELQRFLREVKPDVVHYHGTRAAFFGGLGNLLGRHYPSLYTVHGLAWRKESTGRGRVLFGAAEAVSCRGVDHVVSVSNRDLTELRERGWVGERGTYVPNAVNTERFQPGDQAAARRRLGISEDAFLVGTVSRLVPQKGVRYLIEAMGYCPDMDLLLIGDGPLREELLDLASGMEDRIHFVGARTDVPELLPALDVFALSSLWEGQPIALLEAFACGVPAVASATDGSSELMGEIPGGLVVPLSDPEGLAGAFNRLRADPGLREELGRAGRAGVIRRSHGEIARTLHALYTEVVG